MTDYIAVGLNGFVTGFSVIVAHELWDVVKEYRKKLRESRFWRNGTT